MVRSEELELAADREAPRLARHRVLALCPGLDDETHAVASLLTSELVTNAVLHPRRRGPGMEHRITVHIRCVGSRLRVEVHDDDPQSVPSPRPLADGLDEHGRGLYLVASLASDWGSHVPPNGDKSVWFELVDDHGDPPAEPRSHGHGTPYRHEGLVGRIVATARWLRVQIAKIIT